MRSWLFPSIAILVGLACIVQAGCSSAPGSVQAKGKVVRTDGKPVTSGSITFLNDIASFNSEIGADGSFALGGNAPGDGAAPGKYKVFLQGDCLGGGYEEKPAEVDKKYASADTSPLEHEITGSKSDIEIKVDPPDGS